jgi:cellulose biosynthesis protein BcsQ
MHGGRDWHAADPVSIADGVDWERDPRPFRVLTLTSNKGGVGKTTIATNLAVYLRALREDLPVLLLAFDEQPMLDRMFAIDSQPPRETTLTAMRAGSFASAIRLGQYGVHYVPTSPDVWKLKRQIEDPFRLQKVLRRTGWRGIVIVDTKSDVEILTQNAIAASDLALVLVKDEASLIEAERVYALLDQWNRSRDLARILLSLIDLRVKYRAGEERDILGLLLLEIRHRGYPLFETFVSRSPKIESLYTNPEGRAFSILHGARNSLIHRQMHHLAADALSALSPGAALDASVQKETTVTLRALTRQAARALPVNPLRIKKFPFSIGRLAPFVQNDLMIPDEPPWQVSRYHAQLIERDGQVGVLDRHSRVGTLVDGRTLGGPNGDCSPAFFRSPVGNLVLGNKQSPFAYEVEIGGA